MLTSGVEKEQPVVLIVDDEKSFLTAHKIFFELLSYHVMIAENIKEAKEKAHSTSEDIIALIDGMLPDGSGLELIQYFNTVAPHRIACYFMTGSWSAAVAVKARRFGSYGSFEKNQDLQTLISTLPDPTENPVLQLMRAAAIDDMTGLDNLRQFRRLTHEKLRDLKSGRNHRLTMVAMDLNRFKVINDTYGHTIGSEMIVQVAHKLKENMRPSDHLCRYGGDEFGVCLLDEDEAISKVLQRLKLAVEDAVLVAEDGTELKVSCSIGAFTVTKDDLLNVHEDIFDYLWKNADLEQYKDKKGLGRQSTPEVS